MEIGNGKGPVLSQLSTMANHTFVIDDVKCTSLESFIQSLKFERATQCISVAGDKAKTAKERGKKQFNWCSNGHVHWKGQPMDRDSALYWHFLEHVFMEVAKQSSSFATALIESGDLEFTCIGKSLPSETPITEKEYVRLMNKTRNFANKMHKATLAANS